MKLSSIMNGAKINLFVIHLRHETSQEISTRKNLLLCKFFASIEFKHSTVKLRSTKKREINLTQYFLFANLLFCISFGEARRFAGTSENSIFLGRSERMQFRGINRCFYFGASLVVFYSGHEFRC